MKEKIILIGGGGHCKSCIDVIEQANTFQIAGIVDVQEKLNQKILGYEVIATDDDLPRLVDEYKNFLISMGQIKSPEKRIGIFQILKESGVKLPIIVSPLAHVSKYATIGEGSIIMHHAVINPDVKIGNNCIINTKALVEHDSKIGDHCHISTNSTVNGGVNIDAEVFVGSGATLREYIHIGKRSFIGQQCKITKDVADNSIIKS